VSIVSIVDNAANRDSTHDITTTTTNLLEEENFYSSCENFARIDIEYLEYLQYNIFNLLRGDEKLQRQIL